jgi:hypothetical protein
MRSCEDCDLSGPRTLSPLPFPPPADPPLAQSTTPIPSNATVLSVPITGLLGLTSYRVRLAVSNVGGPGPFSPTSNNVTTLPRTPPSVPTNLTMGNVTGSTMVVNWNAPAESGGSTQRSILVCRYGRLVGDAALPLCVADSW